MNKPGHIAFCGDVCSSCPRYTATLGNNEKVLENTAELWYQAGFSDEIVSNEEIRCEGCNQDKKCPHGINTCNNLVNNNNCGECVFYPCDKMSRFFLLTENRAKHCRSKCTEDVFENLYRAFFMKEERLTAINTARFKDPAADLT